MRKRVIIDCDPGIDDAVALLAALGSSSFDVIAITTCAGNVDHMLTAENARTIVGLTRQSRELRIARGVPGPLLRERVSAETFHGTTGLGGLEFPEAQYSLSRSHSVSLLRRAFLFAQDEPLTLIATGPLTNIALAIAMDPEAVKGISEILIMGGADKAGGNITPFAEFNIFADPHAAARVFASSVPIRCFSLDVTLGIRSTQERVERIREIGSVQAKAAADLLDAANALEMKARGKPAAPLHDPSPVIGLERPDLFSGRKVGVEIDLEPGERFGQTRLTEDPDGHVTWIDQADADGVFETLEAMLRGHEA